MLLWHTYRLLLKRQPGSSLSTPVEEIHPFRAIFVVVFSVEREFFIDNLLVRVHHIDYMSWLTGLAPSELQIPFPM